MLFGYVDCVAGPRDTSPRRSSPASVAARAAAWSPRNTSASKYWLAGDPADCEGLEVGFVNGRDTPELFVQDDPRMGAVFTNDQISYKVRFEFGAGIVNYRPFVGYMT